MAKVQFLGVEVVLASVETADSSFKPMLTSARPCTRTWES